MTPAIDIIPNVRHLIQDETVPYRWSDSELVGWVNDGLNVLVDLRPDLFNQLGTHTCVSGAEQLCSFTRMRLVQEVMRIVGGNGLLQTHRHNIEPFNPSWYNDTPGPAVNWMLHPESPFKFYLYPPAIAGQQVIVRYVGVHPTVGVTDSINLPENYASTLIAWCVYRSQCKDDEAVNNSRMQIFLSDFTGMAQAGNATMPTNAAGAGGK